MTSSKDKKKYAVVGGGDDSLFERVTIILEQARANVVRSVNSNMVLAYWLIGREIIEEAQAGEERAEYGKQVIERLSKQLTDTCGKGFSVANLKLFRQFFQTFHDRLEIGYPAGSFLSNELDTRQGANSHAILSQPGRELPIATAKAFDPNLSWSHYRALMRVNTLEARDFYEQEAVECGWTKVQLERQIQTSYYERILQNKGTDGMLSANRERLPGDPVPPVNILKSPYVLEFLNLPDSPDLHESDLEQAIINNLQSFLLEMGKGFSFVARQKKIHFDGDNFYIDLVFYNFVLKCFLLIDLKIGKLSHRKGDQQALPGQKWGVLG